MYTIAERFGLSSDQMARADQADATTPLRTYSTAENSPYNAPPRSAIGALFDPRGSAIFWVALAAILGLILVTGQIRVEGAIGSRVGKR